MNSSSQGIFVDMATGSMSHSGRTQREIHRNVLKPKRSRIGQYSQHRWADPREKEVQ